MPTTLMIICFQQYNYLFPEKTQHWRLFLADENDFLGTTFEVYNPWPASTPTLVKIPDYEPAIWRDMKRSVIIADSLDLDVKTLESMCQETAENHSFRTITNNCQHFCVEVLQRLIQKGVLTQEQFEQLAVKGFKPLQGWQGFW